MMMKIQSLILFALGLVPATFTVRAWMHDLSVLQVHLLSVAIRRASLRADVGGGWAEVHPACTT